MSGRITPAVRAMEQTGATFQLLEYDYDPSADEIGLQAARALGRRPSTVFKTLVVALDSGELVCAIIPSNARLNLKAIASAAGARKAEPSDPKKAERTTGYVEKKDDPRSRRPCPSILIDLKSVIARLALAVDRKSSHVSSPLRAGRSCVGVKRLGLPA
jgi:Cys-tRNA(Pro)/Cys-tRNA(Cys) deacylase